jgi:hypothetical protein
LSLKTNCFFFFSGDFYFSVPFFSVVDSLLMIPEVPFRLGFATLEVCLLSYLDDFESPALLSFFLSSGTYLLISSYSRLSSLGAPSDPSLESPFPCSINFLLVLSYCTRNFLIPPPAPPPPNKPPFLVAYLAPIGGLVGEVD